MLYIIRKANYIVLFTSETLMLSRAHKIRLYPNKAQKQLLRKTVGVTRYAYNWGLDKWKELYGKGEKTGGYVLSKLWTREKPEWAKEVSATPVQHGILNLDAAYKAFFKHKAKHPTRHKRGRHDSAYFSNQKAHLQNKKIYFQRIGWIRMAEPFRYEDAKINSYVVSCKANQWFVSVQCEIDDERRTDATSVVGVDVGLKHWAVASDGSVLDEPKKLKHLRRELARKQRLAARKQRGSKNQRKAYLKVSRLYQRIDNIKKDAVHKFTSTISKNHGVVVVEDLCIEGMKKGVKSIRKGVQNTCMGEIHRQLTYKCNNYVVVDRFFPSSKTCSHCGSINDALTLSDRTYQCRVCGFTIDRDLNAALNLLKEGTRKLSTVGHTVKDCGASPKDYR